METARLIRETRRRLAIKSKQEIDKLLNGEIKKVENKADSAIELSNKAIDSIKETNLALESITEASNMAVKIAQETSKQEGRPGKNGYTPIKGIDYFTDGEIENIKKEITPRKNIDYFDGKNGKNGKDGKSARSPIKGIDYFTDKEIEDIKREIKPIKGIDYKDGKNGSPDTAEEIRDKLTSLTGSGRLSAKAIKDIDKYIGKKVVTAVSAVGDVGNLRHVKNRITDYTSTISDEVIRFTQSATLTLISAEGTGRMYTIIADAKNIELIVKAKSGETINREPEQILYDGDAMIVHDVEEGKWCIG